MARNACNAAPATIEMFVGGMYIVAHQERGWPKQLVVSETGRTNRVSPRPNPRTASVCSRLAAWIREVTHPVRGGASGCAGLG